jgi:hypothetical protein
MHDISFVQDVMVLCFDCVILNEIWILHMYQMY